MVQIFAKWTNQIHEEWIDSVLKVRPDINRDSLEYVRDLMNRHVADSMVENYQSLIQNLTLPDPKDRHILAAAIQVNAQIITFNLADFPTTILDLYGIKATHPDDFVMELININLVKVCYSLGKVRRRLKNPPRSTLEYLDTLEKNNLKKIALFLSEHLQSL